jgi:hypothetical protein
MAVIIGGIIPLIINFILQIVSYVIQRRLSKKPLIDSLDESCCGIKGYLFLFPSRSSFTEVIFVVFLTGIYGSLMTYFIHDQTFNNLNRDSMNNSNNIYFMITILIIVLSSYSLFSKTIPESTLYLTNDSFSIISSHYQRVGYSIIIAGSLCIAEFSSGHHENLLKLPGYVAVAYWANLCCLIMQMIGMLSNPVVTLLWLLE